MAQFLPTFQALTSKKAILFDMDGTLFDTEGLHAQALCLVLADQGHHFCAAEIQKNITDTVILMSLENCSALTLMLMHW